MDFFESQDVARRKTGLLIFYYALAAVLIILAVYAVATLTFTDFPAVGPEAEHVPFWDWSRLLVVGALVILLVLSGSFYKTRQLSAGGKAVARLLGGRPVSRDTGDPDERRLLNIVEEISIASGVQVPEVFILERESGINAFAAGFSQDDAAVAVTKGCLESLSRDELQGVVAHEFSHILNGDMRLNIRLMGVLFGIMCLTFIGLTIFRMSLYSSLASGRRPVSRSRSRGSSSDRGGGRIAIILFGIALIIIGSIGVFFGKLIKSAISRQREYLSDAAAVQFTRNPAGIAGALKKIGGLKNGSRVKDQHANEASHLFFANGLSGSFSNLMATHPPLVERIRRIDPAAATGIEEEPAQKRSGSKASTVSGFAVGAGAAADNVDMSPQQVVSSVGTARPEHLSYASEVLHKIPSSLRLAAHKTSGAEAVIYALLLSKDRAAREKQVKRINEHADGEVARQTINMADEVQNLPVEYRIPLLDMAIPTLRDIPHEAYEIFIANIRQMVAADGKIALFEYAVQKMILCHLKPAFSKPRPPQVRYHSLKPLTEECRMLLSCLAHYGVDDEAKKTDAFNGAFSRLKTGAKPEFIPRAQLRLKALDAALDKLEKAAPKLKKQILDASVFCVLADGWITVKQAELLRIIADTIGCPIPPMLPGKA